MNKNLRLTLRSYSTIKKIGLICFLIFTYCVSFFCFRTYSDAVILSDKKGEDRISFFFVKSKGFRRSPNGDFYMLGKYIIAERILFVIYYPLIKAESALTNNVHGYAAERIVGVHSDRYSFKPYP